MAAHPKKGSTMFYDTPNLEETIAKNKALAKEKAALYGWDLFATMPSAHGMHYIDQNGINIKIYLDSGNFDLVYNVDASLFRLGLENAGSFSNEAHFAGFYMQITNMVNTLKASGMEAHWWK